MSCRNASHAGSWYTEDGKQSFSVSERYNVLGVINSNCSLNIADCSVSKMKQGF